MPRLFPLQFAAWARRAGVLAEHSLLGLQDLPNLRLAVRTGGEATPQEKPEPRSGHLYPPRAIELVPQRTDTDAEQFRSARAVVLRHLEGAEDQHALRLIDVERREHHRTRRD